MTEQTILRKLQRICGGFNRKARQYHVRGVCTPLVLASKGDQCAYCDTSMGSLRDGSWDHVVPFDKGGTNESDNIVRCCTSCQRRKFTKSRSEYMAHMDLTVTCALPGCDITWQPRWGEYQRGMARYCSRSHSARSRWV